MMRGDPELDRLKQYLRAFTDERAGPGARTARVLASLRRAPQHLSGGGEAALLSRASESERSAVPVEQEIAVDNPQRFGPEVDFADVVRLEAELDGVTGTRIELHRLARHPADLQYQPHRRWGIGSAEGEGESPIAELALSR